jgi:hypothetical protein
MLRWGNLTIHGPGRGFSSSTERGQISAAPSTVLVVKHHVSHSDEVVNRPFVPSLELARSIPRLIQRLSAGECYHEGSAGGA